MAFHGNVKRGIDGSLFHIYTIVAMTFIDFFCVSAFLSCISDYGRTLQISKSTLGMFSSYYGALQLLSSYLMSCFVRRFGNRTCLIWACFLCSFGYLLMGFAQSTWLLFLFRAIPGLFKHTNNISRTIVAKECNRVVALEKQHLRDTNEAEDKIKSVSDTGKMFQAQHFGYLSSASSLGFIIGPVLGAQLYDHFGFFPVALLTAGGFFIMGICSIVSLRNIDDDDNNEDAKPKQAPSSSNKSEDSSPTPKLKSLDPLLGNLWLEYLLQFGMALMMLIYRTNYSVMIKEAYGATTTETSMLTSTGAVLASFSGLLIAPLFKYVGGGSWIRMLRFCAIVQFLIFCGALWAPNLLWLALCTTPLSAINTIARENFQLLWHTKGIHTSAQLSEVIGFSGSLIAFARLIGPFFGGFAHEYGPFGPPLLSTCVSFLCVLLCFRL